jgi:hypothetical protein
MNFTTMFSTSSDRKNPMFEPVTVRVGAERLKVAIREIGRYVGGSRYQMDGRMKKLAGDVRRQARMLAAPVFIYAIHPAAFSDPQRGIRLGSGSYIEVPPEEQDPAVVSAAAVVCTLGAALEDETRRLMTAGDLVAAMFLDAAGVVQLELLAHQARQHLKARARKFDLYTGCPFGPGYNHLPLDSQPILFEHVEAASIGVQLNANGVMSPLKSLSFWVRLTRDPKASENHGYKCRRCEMENCLYRKIPQADAESIPF